VVLDDAAKERHDVMLSLAPSGLGACGAQEERKRTLWTRPVLANELAAVRANEGTEDQPDGNQVVELPRDRDEIRDEVERKRQVPDQPDE
jgi:hypothetical protein